jgi:hypothetical protein
MQLSIKPEKIFVAWLSMLKTLSVCVLLTITSMSFTNDASAYIL